MQRNNVAVARVSWCKYCNVTIEWFQQAYCIGTGVWDIEIDGHMGKNLHWSIESIYVDNIERYPRCGKSSKTFQAYNPTQSLSPPHQPNSLQKPCVLDLLKRNNPYLPRWQRWLQSHASNHSSHLHQLQLVLIGKSILLELLCRETYLLSFWWMILASCDVQDVTFLGVRVQTAFLQGEESFANLWDDISVCCFRLQGATVEKSRYSHLVLVSLSLKRRSQRVRYVWLSWWMFDTTPFQVETVLWCLEYSETCVLVCVI